MAFDQARITAAIERALVSDGEMDSATARDVAFHMTDWLDDLGRYVDFCESPDASSDDAITKMLILFLVHAPNHLAAAQKLLMGYPVTDVFGIGALDGDSDLGDATDG